ncbi:MAG: hypothetical protein AB7F79_06840 [Steroidobacteraceae bacterium]
MRLVNTVTAVLATFATLACASAWSEEVNLPANTSSEAPVAVTTPARGVSMSQVEARFGAPTQRNGAIGNPPITRWDYPNFSVFFEYQYVVHSVIR